MAFDAGTIIARMDLDDREFDRKLRADVARIEEFEKRSHEVKLGVGVDEQGMAHARESIKRLDQQVTQDARRRGGLLSMLAGGGKSILGAAGPGFNTGLASRLLSARTAGIVGAGGIGLGALPALAGAGLAGGVGLAGVGVAAGLGMQVAAPAMGLAQKQSQAQQALAAAATPAQRQAAQAQLAAINKQAAQLSPALHSVFTSITGFQKWWEGFTKSLAPMIAGPARIITSTIEHLGPVIRQVFGGAMTLITPFVRGLGDVVRMIGPGLGQAFRAAAPLMRPLLDGIGMLVRGVLPGLVSLLRAARPAMDAFGSVLGTIGRGLGGMLTAMAPAIKASSIILRGLGDLLGALFPIVGKLAGAFARNLAPVFTELVGVVRQLLPFLRPIGDVLAKLAGAILRDLVALLRPLAELLVRIAPSFDILARALGQTFDILENVGVFGVLAGALERLARPLARLINDLVRQLAPILPVLIQSFGLLLDILVQLTAAGLAGVINGLDWLIRHVPGLVPIVVASWLAFKGYQMVATWVGVARKAIEWLTAEETINRAKSIADMVVKVAKTIWSTGVIVASYVAQAAAATAAFIAENIATLGIIAGIALLVAAIIYLATHWRQVWGEVKRLAKDAWDFLTHGWGQVLIPQLYVIRKVVEFVRDHWRQAWNDITGAARDAWNVIQRIGGSIANLFTRTLPGVFHDGVNSISSAWSRLGNVLKGPVNWVIGNVINGLIRAFDWVSSKVGGPNIKIVPQLARGGKLPGFGGGDILPALLEPGETVVSKEHSRTPVARALFEAMGVPGYQQGGVAPGHPLRPRSLGQAAPHAGLGGLGQAIGGVFHKAADVGKIMAAVTSGNSKALSNAIIDMIPGGVGGATAMMAQLLTAEPHKLLQEIVHKLIGLGSVSGSGASIVRYAESFLGKIPYVWGGTSVPGGADCSGFVQAIYRHFGIMAPRTSEAQGTWVQRGAPRAGGLAFYDSPAGGAPPGHVAIVRNATSVISQGGGMGPTLMGLHGMPLMYTGVPPGGFGTGGRGVNATGPLQLFARRLLASYGWAGQWPAFNALEMSEAGWDPRIVNPSSGAYGIPQALPGSKMASAGADWRTSGYTQLRWMMNYIRTNGNFHDPASAWAFHQRNNWYDQGGWLSPEAMLNGTGRPEAVLNPGQSQAFLNLSEAAHRLSRGGGGGGGGALMRDVHLMLPEGTTLAEALREIGWALRTTRQQSFTGVPGG